jgi:hypothetical protein
MITVVFANGTTANFTDDSTPEELITVVQSFASVDPLRVQFNEENMVGMTIDETIYANLLPVATEARANVGENVEVHFINRFKTNEEIMQEQITELQQAVAEIGG